MGVEVRRRGMPRKHVPRTRWEDAMVASVNEAVRKMRLLERSLLEAILFVLTLRGKQAREASDVARRTRRALVEFLKGLDIPTTGSVEARLRARKAALRRMPRTSVVRG
mgnify:CR=1 FL=1